MSHLITFKYDSYEKELGGGYYPQLHGQLDGTSSHLLAELVFPILYY